MEKAASAVRRGSVRLSSSLGSGHRDLKLAISEKKNVKKTLKSCMKAQQGAAIYLSKWADNEENEAIQDVVLKITELTNSWVDVQKDLISDVKQNAAFFERILESEKTLDQAKKNLESCQTKEKKLKKEIERLAKKGEDTTGQQAKLEKAIQTTELAAAELDGCHMETEAFKAALLRLALSEYAETFQRMAVRCGILFEAQQRLSTLIPEFHGRDTSIPPYTGSSEATAIVEEAHVQVRTGVSPSTTSQQTKRGPPPASALPPPPSYSSVVQANQPGQDANEDFGWGSDEFDD